MKKNISINISGIIFHIEEDGYDRLREYLDSINQYFSSFDDSNEIIADIESRIAEIFLEKLKEGNRQVVTAEDVEALVATMGTVADFQAVEEPEPETREEEPQAEPASGPRETPTKLFRDMRRRVIGGVASGIAHYFSIDPLWIRLIFIILFFNIFLGFGLSGFVLLVYIIMWIVVPSSADLEEDKTVKKMYRDSEQKVLGGVASGLAAYFGADITVIRLLFVLSIFLGGSGLIIYIILWIITPEAKSITEKMQMQGEPVTLSNIETTVKERLNVKEEEDESAWVKILLLPFRIIAAVFKGLAEILGPSMKFLVEALRVVVAIAIILTGLGLIFALTVLTGIFLGFFTGLEGWVTVQDLPYQVFVGTVPALGVISLFICIFVPALAIGLLGFTLLFKTTITNSYVGWALFGLWIIGLIGAGLTIPKTAVQFRRSGEVSVTRDYDLNGKQAVLRLREVGLDDYSGVKLTLRGHRDSVYTLVTDYEARGRNRQDAQANAGMIEYEAQVRDSVFTFDSNVSFKDDASFRFQEVSMVLYVPYGQVFTMDPDLEYILRNTIHRYGYSVDDMANNEWTFSSDGLECLSCPGRRYREDRDDDRDPVRDTDDRSYEGEKMTFDFEDFDEVDASSRFDIEIRKGDRYRVELFGRESSLEKVKLKQSGDVLELDMKDYKLFGLRDWKAVKVELTMPELTSISLSGACSATTAGFSGNDLEVDLSGASEADLEVSYDELDIDLSGTANLELSGEARELVATLSGTSSLDALWLEAEVADIETSGVSSAKVNVRRDLVVNAHGASDVQYKGDPRVDADESRASSVSPY